MTAPTVFTSTSRRYLDNASDRDTFLCICKHRHWRGEGTRWDRGGEEKRRNVWENRRGGQVEMWLCGAWEINWDMRGRQWGEGSKGVSAAWKGGRKHGRRWIKKRISVISSEGRRFMSVTQMWSDQHIKFVIHIQKWRMAGPPSQSIPWKLWSYVTKLFS